MYKNYAKNGGWHTALLISQLFKSRIAYPSQNLKRLLMRVKLTCAFIVIAFLQLSFASNAQNITLTKKNISLTELFKEIKKQSGYDFVYKHDLLIKGKSISIDVKNRPLKEVLDQSFENQPFSYSIESKTVVVLPKEKEKNVYQVSPPLSGKVVDKDGNPLAGVSVAVKGGSKGTQTDANGNFTLAVSAGSTLVFSYLGFVTQDIVYNNQKAIDVVLSESPQALNEVVVVGYGTQKK
uniref:STN domain-containing protein n=1 Tax=Pseudopedobacter sp. TaxID=1936787 RepID=UPI00334210FB